MESPEIDQITVEIQHIITIASQITGTNIDFLINEIND